MTGEVKGKAFEDWIGGGWLWVGKRMGKQLCNSLCSLEMAWLVGGKRTARVAGAEWTNQICNCRARGCLRVPGFPAQETQALV